MRARGIEREEGRVRDPEIRGALARELRRSRVLAGHAVAVQELGLCRSEVLVDVAVVNGRLHGFEIKSDFDTLRRLEGQARTYGLVLDRATLVVGARHLERARSLVPDWWGLMLVEGDGPKPAVSSIRPPADNPARCARALAELLWMNETRVLLERRGAIRGCSGKPRRVLWDRLCEVYSLREIASFVRAQLKVRAAAGLLRRLW